MPYYAWSEGIPKSKQGITMLNLSPEQPIGIFDSGVGGLTIAKSIVHFLPKESVIYFGDTAHLPYGDKSTAAIQAYSVKIASMLLQNQCKLIVIACNSASAAAYELMKEYVHDQAFVIDVINPTANFLRKNYNHKRIGLIGTKQTVFSNIYKKKINHPDTNIDLCTHATPLLASAIEEGLGETPVIDSLLSIYLNNPNLNNIEALVLACTHYPVIKNKIAAFYNNQIPIIDTSDIIAQTVFEQLSFHQLLNTKGSGQKHFYISDYTESFATSTRLFFDETIRLEHYPLWD